MKTNTTDEQIKGIISALGKLHKLPFDTKSNDNKANAQRNLKGLTHYVDDDTLRWHHSRIVGCTVMHGGLLLRVTCSDALDMNNTRRGFRACVFDVFGTCISREKLEDAHKTREKAISASEDLEIDLVAHYAEAMARQIRDAKRIVQDLEAGALALSLLETKEALPVA